MRCFVLLCALLASAVYADDYYVLPFDADPAVVADGNLDDWGNIPNAITVNKKENATFGPDMWDGPEDLSVTYRLAWRRGVLAIAAEVTDSSFLQPFVGRDIWKGDHINLWMDFTPGVDPQRQMFGEGQFHVVISPGDFGKNPPEIYVYRPEGQNPGPGSVAAKRTKTGYIVEAVIPVERLKIDAIDMFKDADFEIAVSDADAAPAKQETFITLDTRPWHYRRDRLLPMMFGDGNGKAPPPQRGASLVKHHELKATESLTVTFQSEKIADDKQPFIFLKARYPSKKVSGWRSNALSLQVNGQRVTGDRINNRPAKATVMSGKQGTFITPDGQMAVYYTPKYGHPVVRDSNYGTLDGTDPTEYEFSVAGLLVEGENKLTITNHIAATDDYPFLAHVDDVEFRIKAKVQPPPPPKPAPTGEMPWVSPQRTFPKIYSDLSVDGSKLAFSVGAQRHVINSRFSTPDGQWVTASNPHFAHSRRVVEHDEYIEVFDSFENLSGKNLPLMQQHACDLGDAFRAAWLGGMKMPNGDGVRSIASNPSIFATTATGGIGMYPTNDVFLVHANQTSRDGVISLSDSTCYLRPGAKYTASFAVVPIGKPDFWTFINAARRARDVNFPLKWMFAFMFHDLPVYKWTEKRFRSFVEHKGANLLVQSNSVRNRQGRYARATDFINADLRLYTDFQERVRGWYPDGDVKTGIYYHCFLDTTRRNDETYREDRGLDAAGNHINYGGKGAYMHYFIPTTAPGSGFGKVMARLMDVLLEDIGCDGIFWDEFIHSRVAYVYNMDDNHSADIDQKTHKLIRTKGAASLLSLPFRVQRVDRIQRENRPFLINGAPATRTMVDKKFMAFTETGSMTNCRYMLLHSPVALGDHLTEKKYADSYANMHAAIDHGCLFVWYSHIFHDFDAPTKYMFPATPIEIREGIHIAQERIITNRSGNYGWNDFSKFESHVFDREGREDPDFKVPVVQRDGFNYAELRLPEGYYAILVRK